jgi:Uma2 family endonuclease
MAATIRSAARKTVSTTVFGPASNGISMTPAEFDRAEFEEGWRYELIRGVLVVSPAPLEEERDPNGELEYLLRLYRETHPHGKALDKTLSEHTVVTGRNRRRADRVIWAGLGRLPRRREKPTIVVEFVSGGRANRYRDYKEKRDEYLAIGVREYWVFDRFDHTLTVFVLGRRSHRRRNYGRMQTYKTPLLPGFVVPLDRLFALADSWADDSPASPD